MRNTGIKVVLFICTLILLSTKTVAASSMTSLSLIETPLQPTKTLSATGSMRATSSADKKENDTAESDKKVEETAPAPQPKQHTVAPGETLTKVAALYETTWNRMFDKNTQLTDPDVLSVGETLVIPEPSEPLPPREAPITAPVATAPAPRSTSVRTGPITRQAPVGSTTGNTYTPGYCTWYVKNRRPDLPNRLGNASAWVSSAAARGYATGSAPQAGAVGQQGNHVVYVERVNGDGTVTVSDMNYAGLFVVTTRTVAASSFRYIY